VPKRVGGDDRQSPIRIRKLRAVIDRNDPRQVAAWEAAFGKQWRERQERERRGDRPYG